MKDHQMKNKVILQWPQGLGHAGRQLTARYTEALSRRQSYPHDGMGKVVICLSLAVFEQRLNDYVAMMSKRN